MALATLFVHLSNNWDSMSSLWDTSDAFGTPETQLGHLRRFLDTCYAFRTHWTHFGAPVTLLGHLELLGPHVKPLGYLSFLDTCYAFRTHGTLLEHSRRFWDKCKKLYTPWIILGPPIRPLGHLRRFWGT